MQSHAVFESPSLLEPFSVHLGIYSPNLKPQCFKLVELATQSSKTGARAGVCVVRQCQELQLPTNLLLQPN